MVNLILFGPPGIGKSTIIGILKTKGIGAIDLEDVYPNRVRFQIPNMIEGKVIGAADLNPRRGYIKSLKVLLTARQDEYDKRRGIRDAQVEGKSNQAQHNVEDWQRDTSYDYVIDTTKQDAATTAKRIADIYKEVNHE